MTFKIVLMTLKIVHTLRIFGTFFEISFRMIAVVDSFYIEDIKCYMFWGKGLVDVTSSLLVKPKGSMPCNVEAGFVRNKVTNVA